MATQAELNQAQLLYVAYYGRPADPAGLEFWAEQIAEVGVAGIAADFGNSAEFEAEFGDLGSVALINNLYQQLFGRDAEAEGLQYWLDVLAEGTPLASIALEIANGAQGGDATGLQNKVTLANQFTAAVAAGDVSYDGADAAAYGRAFLATINENTNVENYDVQAVVDGIASGVLPADTADLRSALEELSAAEQAKVDFLEGIDNEAVLDAAGVDPELDDIEAAIETVYTAAAADLIGFSGADGIVAGFGERSAAAQDALIAETVSTAQTAVTTAEGKVATGVTAALATVETRTTAYEAAIATAATAQTAYNGEAARFEVVNSVATNIVANADDVNEITVDGAVIARQGANGNYTLVANAPVAGLDGVDALLASASTLGRADLAEANAKTALDNAIVAVVRLELDVTADELSRDAALALTSIDDSDIENVVVEFGGAGLEDIATLLTARAELATLNELVEAFQAARELNTELATLDAAVEAAKEAIVELGFNLITDLSLAATEENDVYLFAVEDAAPFTIGGFGDEGVDRIFFGPDYKLVQLEEGQDLKTARLGSTSELEIFWQQDGDNLVLFVEETATAGNALNNDEITQITLTGVNAEDISFTSGFLAAGSIA